MEERERREASDVRFSTRMVASLLEERIKDMSVQGKEKIHHVWGMEVWTKLRL